MDELIKQILEIEDKAQKIVSDAKKAESELDERIERDLGRMRADIEKSMNEKSASMLKTENDETEKTIGEIAAETERKIAVLEKKYRQNREQWVTRIVEGVIGK